ncbi:MAG TPA: acyl-CoA thioesterase [Clostridiaceae bacterium]|jgi:acyl-CoA thioester hydrolase|nr:acyl-CoA thioesterase [Clostridiaceae bacterium]
MICSETKLIVRYAETDKMGIVHHSNYLVWFEAGRTDFVKKLGMSYSDIESMGIMLPLIELNCKFYGSATYEDEITVITSIKDITYTRIYFNYEILKKGCPKPIVTGETVHVWTNTGLKPVNLKKYKPEIYNLLAGIKA